MSLLDVQKLAITYSIGALQQEALKGISCSIETGETLAVIGESGSGKSSLAKFLLTILPPTARPTFEHCNLKLSALLRYEDQRNWKAQLGRTIAYIPQNPQDALNPILSCGRQLRETLKTIHPELDRQSIEQRINTVLASVALTPQPQFTAAFPHQLSGGQQQRIVLALALLHTPKLIIADEPTSALDAVTRKQFIDLLKTIQREHQLALLLITHELDVATYVADRVLVLQNGRVQETTSGATFRQAPQSVYGKKLLADYLAFAKASYPLRKKEETVVISIEQLTATYQPDSNAEWALRIPSLAIHRGSFILVAGKSGSGKSTFGKALLQQMPFQKGTLTISGQRWDQFTPPLRRQYATTVQMVFQNSLQALNPRLSVGYQIQEAQAQFVKFRAAKGAVSPSLSDWLQLIGLTEADGTRLPHEFSGGQQQRIALIRALACQPEVLICDELFASQDYENRRLILDVLKKFQLERQLTVLFVSHDLIGIEHFADRLLVFHEGAVVDDLPLDGQPISSRHPATQTLLEAVL